MSSPIILSAAEEAEPPPGFRALFDGKTLNGWHAVPRGQGTSLGDWRVEDGALVGRRKPVDSEEGSYLLTDQTFGDFELLIDAKPDWPADTGVLVRNTDRGGQGFQIHCDYRSMGSIGTFFFNGVSGGRVRHFAFDAVKDANGNVTSLKPMTNPDSEKVGLTYTCAPEEFFRAWKVNQWNTIRIRCVGAMPVITTWVNDVKIAEVNTATMQKPNYDPAAVAKILGAKGRIAVEVHNDDNSGIQRWGPGGACRWRNIYIKEL